MSERVTYHVVPDANSWKVKNTAEETYEVLVDHKDRAIELAKERAKSHELGQVIVHNRDGKISDEFTYGSDPRNVPG